MRRKIGALLATILVTFTVLSACGGSGSNSGPTPPPTPPQSASSSIIGVASKGLLSGATVTAYTLNAAGVKGKILGTTTTDLNGAYAIDLGTYSGAVLVEVVGGAYTDESTGFANTANSTLLRAAVANASGAIKVAVTPMTEIAVELAGTLTAANIDSANTVVSNMIGGTNIITVMPVNVLASSPSTTDARNYGLALATISQMVKDGTASSVSNAISQIVGDLANNMLAITGTNMSAALNTFIASGNNQTGLTAGTAPVVAAVSYATSNKIILGSHIYRVGAYPSGLTHDATGNIWVANWGSNNVTKLSPTGTVLGTYAVGLNPWNIAIDSSNNVWVTNSGSNSVSKLSSIGTVIATYPVGASPRGIQVDGSGNLWVANYNDNTLYKLNSSDGAILCTFTTSTGPFNLKSDSSGTIWVTNYGNGTGNSITAVNSNCNLINNYTAGTGPHNIDIDSAGYLWVSNAGNDSSPGNTVSKLTSTGLYVGTYTVGSQPRQITFDNSGNVWVASMGSAAVPGDAITVLSPAGAVINTVATGGYRGAGMTKDPSGNIWIANYGSGTVTVFYTGTPPAMGTVPATVNISGKAIDRATYIPVPGLTITARHPWDTDNTNTIAQTTSAADGSFSLTVSYGIDLYLNISGSSSGVKYVGLNLPILRNVTQPFSVTDHLAIKLSDLNSAVNAATYNGSTYAGGIGSRAWLFLDAFAVGTMNTTGREIAGVTYSGTPFITYFGYNDGTNFRSIVSPPTVNATVADPDNNDTPSGAVAYNTSALILAGTASKSGSPSVTDELPLVPGEATYDLVNY